MEDRLKNIALLIDADNVKPDEIGRASCRVRV